MSGDVLPGSQVRWLGYAMLALAVVVVVGPCAWVLMNSFKTQIAILTGAWQFTPSWDNYVDVLFSRRSDFVRAFGTSWEVRLEGGTVRVEET